ncbi:MAG: hypothetical protein MJ211_12725 [Bacteroidales bacterium]|nr:hypothetical protein [Bacteroidales bacterium]
MKKTSITLFILAIILSLFSCSDSSKNEFGWTPPEDSIINTIKTLINEQYPYKLSDKDTIYSKSKTLITYNQNSDRRQYFGCYQISDSAWLAIINQFNSNYYYLYDGRKITPIYSEEASEYCKELSEDRVKLEFYDDHFTLTKSKSFLGTLSLYSSNTGLKRVESEDYCTLLFRTNPPNTELAFNEIPDSCCKKEGKTITLTSNKYALMAETEAIGEYQPLTIGSNMSDASGYEFYTKFKAPFNYTNEQYQENGKLVIKRGLFYNYEKKISAFVLFIGDNLDSKISEIKFVIEPLDFSEVAVDYTKPICTIQINETEGGEFQYIIGLNKYNENEELIEHYNPSEEFDMPTIHNIVYYYRHDGEIDTIPYHAMDCEIYDFLEKQHNYWEEGIGLTNSESSYLVPKKYDETKYDNQDRLVYSKYKADYGYDTWEKWEVNYKYIDDYCIQTVKFSGRYMGEEGLYNDNKTYKVYEYYLHTTNTYIPTMKENIESSIYQEIYSQMPKNNLNGYYQNLDDLMFDSNIWNGTAIGREGDIYSYICNYWIEKLSDGSYMVFYNNFEENEEGGFKLDTLYTYKYKNGVLTSSQDFLPKKTDIAFENNIEDPNTITDIKYNSTEYNNLKVSYRIFDEFHISEFYWDKTQNKFKNLNN